MPVTVPVMASTGLIPKILDQIIKAKTPVRYTAEFQSDVLGYGSASARPFIGVLKKLGFISSDGAPTSLYRQFRSNRYRRRAMAEAIRQGYASLYAVEEFVHELSAEKLKFLIVHVTGHDKNVSTVGMIVRTFRALREYADFEEKSKLNPRNPIDMANRAIRNAEHNAEKRLNELTKEFEERTKRFEERTKNYEEIIKANEDRFESINSMEERRAEFEKRYTAKSNKLSIFIFILSIAYGAGVLTIIVSQYYDDSTTKSIFDGLPYVFMLILVSSPLIYLVRLLRADAEKAEILREDFFRRRYIESLRISIAESNSELSNEIYQAYAFHWLENSPAETLARINSKAEQPKMHLLEDLLNRLRKTAIKTDTPS